MIQAGLPAGARYALLIGRRKLVRLSGFEPEAYGLGGSRSIHLSYRRNINHFISDFERAVKKDLSRRDTPVFPVHFVVNI